MTERDGFLLHPHPSALVAVDPNAKTARTVAPEETRPHGVREKPWEKRHMQTFQISLYCKSHCVRSTFSFVFKHEVVLKMMKQNRGSERCAVEKESRTPVFLKEEHCFHFIWLVKLMKAVKKCYII